MRIGILGMGLMGGKLGTIFAHAGHEVTFSYAHNDQKGAWFASNASCHRGAHRHQRSPGFRPGKPNSGCGVDRSLPRDLENSRNAEVITAQIV
jgi:hypothetical protein